MKNTKKIAFLCIAINIILLCQLCLGTVMALNEDSASEPEQIVEEAIVEAQGGEMQIMAAAECDDKCSCAIIVTPGKRCSGGNPCSNGQYNCVNGCEVGGSTKILFCEKHKIT